MSEEKKIIEYIKKEYGNFDNYVRDLLDLYQKEKEKNKTLETLLQGNLYQMYLYYKELASRYQANSVSKDKIREKIKDLEDNMILFTNDKEKFNRYKYARNILEKLLEEK